MSYRQPDPARRRGGGAGRFPRPSGSSAIIVSGAVLAVTAMALVIVIERRQAPAVTDDASRSWVAPPPAQQWQQPIPLQSSTPSVAPSPTRSRATGTPRPAVRHPSAGRTPSRPVATLLPVPASRLSLVATGTPGLRLRHRDFRMRLDAIGPDSPNFARSDATFVLRKGLADGRCMSLESVNFPGRFVRHRNFELVLQPREASAAFAADATFCPQPVGAGAQFLLRAANLPDRYVSADGPRVLLAGRSPATAQGFRAVPGL